MRGTRIALRVTFVTLLLTGLVYPLAMTGIAGWCSRRRGGEAGPRRQGGGRRARS